MSDELRPWLRDTPLYRRVQSAWHGFQHRHPVKAEVLGIAGMLAASIAVSAVKPIRAIRRHKPTEPPR